MLTPGPGEGAGVGLGAGVGSPDRPSGRCLMGGRADWHRLDGGEILVAIQMKRYMEVGEKGKRWQGWIRVWKERE